MNTMKRIIATLVFGMIAAFASAQTAVGTQPISTDLMRSHGKILVVVAVILIIMIGFFSYLVSVDRKISRLEKEKQ